MKRFIPFLFILALCTSCNNDDDGDNTVACTEIFIYGLSINVIDSTTGQNVNDGITVTATDGNYSEELMFMGDSWLGAGERPGTYDIMVTSQQYTPASLDGLVVTKTDDDCHVITVSRELFVSPF